MMRRLALCTAAGVLLVQVVGRPPARPAWASRCWGRACPGTSSTRTPGQPDQDELVVRIWVFDYHQPGRPWFDTGVVQGDFSPMTGGGRQCFILC